MSLWCRPSNPNIFKACCTMVELTRSDVINAQRKGSGIVVRVTGTKGSAPRNAGSIMLVEKETIRGTIGGGQAEWLAIKKARGILAGEPCGKNFTLTLGPLIGQCCGGVMEVEFLNVGEIKVKELIPSDNKTCLIFGAGHTGLALARAFEAVDFDIRVIDTRGTYDKVHEKIVISPIPEAHVRNAPPKSIFIVTTHDHGLDFLITAEALKRGDSGYVGMIGSKSKRACFKNWLHDNDYDSASEKILHCPIGGDVNIVPKDAKHPAVIAAMTLVEVLGTLG